MSDVVNDVMNSDASVVKCCKSGWRMCKNGQWKFLLPRGKKRIVSLYINGETIRRKVWIPASEGPPCVWLSLDQMNRKNNKLIASVAPALQICDDCGTYAPPNSNDCCPKCQKSLMIISH